MQRSSLLFGGPNFYKFLAALRQLYDRSLFFHVFILLLEAHFSSMDTLGESSLKFRCSTRFINFLQLSLIIGLDLVIDFPRPNKEKFLFTVRKAHCSQKLWIRHSWAQLR